MLRRSSIGTAHFGARLHKFAEALDADSPASMYQTFVSHWKRPGDVVIGAVEPRTIVNDRAEWIEGADATVQMMYLDLMTYLPDDILVKVDRASMAVGLEARVPLLDHRVVEFALRLPLEHKLQDGRGKRVLRDVLYRHVPRALIDRPKAGFGVPINEWLRGPLREWAGDLLAPHRLRADGYFDPAAVQSLWKAHQAGRADWQYHLWDVLMFQAWYHDGTRSP
jgi:asparagine synthase (glutamine-hydrolysing)